MFHFLAQFGRLATSAASALGGLGLLLDAYVSASAITAFAGGLLFIAAMWWAAEMIDARKIGGYRRQR